MPHSLFTAPEREPSSFVGFAGNLIDRQAENRTEDALERALAEPSTRIMLVGAGRLVLRLDDDGFEPHFHAGEAAQLGADLAEAVLLGRDAQGAVIVAPTSLAPDDLPAGLKAIDHRSIYVQGLIGEAELGALAQGASLLNWHRTHRFCGRCGASTHARIGGYKRVCPACEMQLFPRTDPVAIMLAVRGDVCLLGRSPHFGPGMYSALAGFIEPGETIEAAVRREVREEAGIRLGRVVYHASQPWPFPHTLMIGCYGEALDEAIAFDAAELEDCRWFARAEVRDMLAGAHGAGLGVPPSGSIATHLIRHWADAA